MCCSHDTLLVVLELHDERLDVLALALPFLDALLRVRVEILLLLVSKRLRLESVSLSLLEITNDLGVLYIGLRFLEILELTIPLSLLFLLLLLSELELFVADLPELSVFGVLLLLSVFLGLFALDLQLTRPLDSGLHLSLALLLLLVKTVGTVLSLGDLTVQNLLLVVFKGLKFSDLAVDHFLSCRLFVGKALLFTFLLHVLEMFTLLSKLVDFLFLFDFLQTFSFFNFHEFCVCICEV